MCETLRRNARAAGYNTADLRRAVQSGQVSSALSVDALRTVMQARCRAAIPLGPRAMSHSAMQTTTPSSVHCTTCCEAEMRDGRSGPASLLCAVLRSAATALLCMPSHLACCLADYLSRRVPPPRRGALPRWRRRLSRRPPRRPRRRCTDRAAGSLCAVSPPRGRSPGGVRVVLLLRCVTARPPDGKS